MRRGWTLLELMIVIALLIALGAVAMPVAIDSLHERAFTSAADRIENQLLLARAYAQSGGEPVQVVYQPATSTVEAQRFDPASMISRSSQESSPAGALDDDPVEPAALLEAGSWARQSLDGLRIVSRPPRSHDPASELHSILDEDDAKAPPAGGGVLRLAVYLADGSALLANPVWLVDDDGRMGRFSLNPYTGMPLFERDVPAAEAKGGERVDEPAAGEIGADEAAP